MKKDSSSSFNETFRFRSKEFALELLLEVRKLDKTIENQIITKQLIRSATSVAANFRAATRARSKAEYYSKLCIVVEECDETLFWLEVIIEQNSKIKPDFIEIQKGASELLSVFATTKKQLKENLNSSGKNHLK
jgi:four helix bundle protein